MKKVMIGVVAFAIGLIANAATVNWSANGIVAAPELTDRSTYYAYIFDATAGYSTITEALAKNDVSVLGSAIGSKNVSSSGAVTMGKGTNTAGEGDYVTAFAIVLNATDPSNATYYLAIPEVTSTKAVSSAGTVTLAFGSQAGNTNWTAMSVPEPTSGLMLLLGMAGLALRRRRA